MSNKSKRIIAAGLAAAMLLNMTGCMGSQQKEAEESTEETEVVTTQTNVQTSIKTTAPTEAPTEPSPIIELAPYMLKDSEADVTFISLDKLSQECPECEKAAIFSDMINSVSAKLDKDDLSWASYDPRVFRDLDLGISIAQERLYDLMQHECESETIYVENCAYCYHDFIGYYTGYWKNFGPTGQGTFSGTRLRAVDDNFYTKRKRNFRTTMTYTGEWSCGLPEGQGKLSYSQYPVEGEVDEVFASRHFEEYYSGEFHRGVKQGKGTVVTVFSADGYTTGNRITYYSEGTFEEDVLQGEVDYVAYDDTGMVDSGKGSPGGRFDYMKYGYYSIKPERIPTSTPLDGNTESYESKQSSDTLKTLGAIAIVGSCVYLMIKMADDPELDYYLSDEGTAERAAAAQAYAQQNKEAEEQRQREDEEYREQKQKEDQAYFEKKYQEALEYDQTHGDGKISLDTQNYGHRAGY